MLRKRFHPFQNVCMDDMVIQHMSRWKYKQYYPKNIKESHESTKFVWTGYCYNAVTFIDIKPSYSYLPCILWTIQRDNWTSDKATAQKLSYFFLSGLEKQIRLSFSFNKGTVTTSVQFLQIEGIFHTKTNMVKKKKHL